MEVLCASESSIDSTGYIALYLQKREVRISYFSIRLGFQGGQN
jgi:hypothetical protein